MRFNPYKLFMFCCVLITFCSRPSDTVSQTSSDAKVAVPSAPLPIVLGAARFDQYLDDLKNKKVALVVNQTSVINDVHLVDTFLTLDIDIVKIFSPEHGFRGKQDRGTTVEDGKDSKSGLPLVSLYGSKKKPSPEMYDDIDIIIFDIQDVGARFYTYISTMHYVMEAAAEQGKKVIVLDRPNPNGFYVDGPVLQDEQRSFIGMHNIPIVHGCTVGELANMINEEGWLANGVKCDVKVVKCLNYTHNTPYSLPIKPSPNLPNDLSINLYPSLCLFEGTDISVGRGTTFPFQVLGYPDKRFGTFTFTPKSLEGWEKYPKHQDKICYGEDFRTDPQKYEFFLDKLLAYYEMYSEKEKFFLKSFNLLAGNSTLKEQMIEGWTEEQIRASWNKDLEAYKAMRKKYLLYP
jgi:uncharacterized protein YbbC (DUF1343 family)